LPEALLNVWVSAAWDHFRLFQPAFAAGTSILFGKWRD
jgi:hypothetical protein